MEFNVVFINAEDVCGTMTLPKGMVLVNMVKEHVGSFVNPYKIVHSCSYSPRKKYVININNYPNILNNDYFNYSKDLYVDVPKEWLGQFTTDNIKVIYYRKNFIDFITFKKREINEVIVSTVLDDKKILEEWVNSGMPEKWGF